jgi:menaquinone-9 beta-reductase
LFPEWAEELKSEAHFLGSHGVMFVAPNGKELAVPFRKATLPNDPPGFIAKRKDFDDWLFQKARQSEHVRVFTNTRLENFEVKNGFWEVSGKGENRFKSRLLLVADGAQSRFVRNHLRAIPEEHHFCAGLRAYYKGIKNLNEQGYIELHFLKDVLPGYFWIFPLPNGSANVGLGIRSDVVRKRRLNLKDELHKIITTDPRIAPRFKDASADGPVLGYSLPLGSKKRSLSGEGYMLLGDAGSLIDPFTGEGIGNAMISGMKAAEVIAANYQQKNFSAEALQSYDQSVYKRLWPELSLSYKMQQLVNYPWLFNMVVNKAVRSATLRETIICMFEDIDLRSRLKDPRFYLKILFE